MSFFYMIQDIVEEWFSRRNKILKGIGLVLFVGAVGVIVYSYWGYAGTTFLDVLKSLGEFVLLVLMILTLLISISVLFHDISTGTCYCDERDTDTSMEVWTAFGAIAFVVAFTFIVSLVITQANNTIIYGH